VERATSALASKFAPLGDPAEQTFDRGAGSNGRHTPRGLGPGDAVEARQRDPEHLGSAERRRDERLVLGGRADL
jgi:hypothetical protein